MDKSRVDRRRRHSAEFKARVLAACEEPGVSITQVALENGLNANLIHKWRRQALATTARRTASVPVEPHNDFVPVPILSDRDIRVIVRGRAT